MASQYNRLMEPTTLLNTITVDQPRDQWLDLGAYQTLEVTVRMLKTGSGSPDRSLRILHAPVNNEPDAWMDLVLDIKLTILTPQHFSVPNFSRFIRWATTNEVQGSPAAEIDIVAKGG